MDTIRVDICYRPLRIGWVIRSGDIESFRRAVRLSHGFWGGRFNPIIVVDREKEAKELVDVFRVDFLWPVGNVDETDVFIDQFPYLIKPFFHNKLFIDGNNERKLSQVLDIQNALAYLADSPASSIIKQRGACIYSWKESDPLADVFLVHFGQFASPEDGGKDYGSIFKAATESTDLTIESTMAIPADVLDHITISALSRYGIRSHYSVASRTHNPGFFVGDVTNVNDLVSHWNLRAANIPLLFVDRNHISRYSEIIPAWEKAMRELVAYRHEWERRIAVWTRGEDPESADSLLRGIKLSRSQVSENFWNTGNLQAPMMYLGETSVLGVVGSESERPKINFALAEKPYSGDVWFHHQHLVASVSFLAGLHYDALYTLDPPYIPELNEFYARTMHIEYDKLRIEPGRLGLVVDATDHDSFVYALPVADTIEQIFGMVGYVTKHSKGGLILRQLTACLGGVQGARVFKIPGVRRLLRTYGPNATFTKRCALQLIGSKDPDNPNAKFSDHENLLIESRPNSPKLEPSAVFAYLVEKRLFRIGMRLECPNCGIASWTALDTLTHRVVCQLCGVERDVTRQLMNGEFHYRRSGVLGAEKNAQGAVPVALTLQQLDTNLSSGLSHNIYSPSIDIEPSHEIDLPKCEIDFVWIIPRDSPDRNAIILGECKDRGPIELAEFEKDIENLRRVATAFPLRRFKVFILLSKLSPFTTEEIQAAGTLNDAHECRTILLTDREIEPYLMYERAKANSGIKGYACTPEEMASTTAEMYFKDRLPD